MSGLHAALTRELEVLVQRGMRLGALDLDELVQTYAALAPSSHVFVADPRRIDLAALVGAFGRLPPHVTGAPRLRLVHRLDGFAKGARHHALSDGTILLEARDGLFDIVATVASLCVLLHERSKAHALFRAYGDVPDDPDAVVEHMALALGVDSESLLAASDATGGVLMAWLTSNGPLPALGVHPDLSATATTGRATALAARIVSAFAETGLAGRPVHLWLGPAWFTDCLSPYVRELRPALVHWASSQPAELGADAARALTGLVGEDALYAIAHDLLRARPQLASERDAADRTVGIYRGEGFEVIDLSRVELGTCDPRVSTLTGAYDGSVVVRVAAPREDTSGVFVRELVSGLQGLARITVVLEGMALGGAAGSLVMPELVLHWAGEEIIGLKTRDAWDEDALHSFADARVARGSVMSAPAASLLSASHVEVLARRFKLAGIEIGQIGVLRALAELGWSDHLQLPIALALVGTEHVDTERPSIPSIAGVNALAIASLGEGKAPSFSPPAYDPITAPPSAPPKRPSSPPRPGRGIRIKA